MKTTKNILIAPLDWGLGHITRCIPIIELLLKNGHNVLTCGNKESEQLFKEHFPKIKHITIPGYNPKYSSKNNQSISMIRQIPKFLRKIKAEQKIATQLAKKNKIDYIISDNRFGFRSSETINIFISHQIHIQGPKAIKPLLLKINKRYIDKFQHCWIPDFKSSDNLAGTLSINPKLTNYSYIGPLSRFKKAAIKKKYKYKYLGIVSGPEPQRTILEKKLTEEFLSQAHNCAIIAGIPNGKTYKKKNLDFFSHLETAAFFETVNDAEFLICRSGYSTIMDLSILNKKALLIPTPGQTEQEYLAKYHAQKSSIKWVSQKDFRLNSENTFGKLKSKKSNALLEKEIQNIGL